MESLALIEPLLPGSRSGALRTGSPSMKVRQDNRVLTDLATQLWAESSALNSNLQVATILGIGDLVRTMNCYYSNLIEGHRTHPIDIERALAQDFSIDPQQRELQLEAKAHIEVQREIDLGNAPGSVVSGEYLKWIHREFCTRLPPEMLVLSNTEGSRQIQIVPGEWRTGDVIVGRHIPISAPAIDSFITRFATGYRLERLSQIDRVVAAVFRSGELGRGKAAAASGDRERQGSKVLGRLLAAGLLVSDTPKGAVRVGFPSTLLERYFPRLFLG